MFRAFIIFFVLFFCFAGIPVLKSQDNPDGKDSIVVLDAVALPDRIISHRDTIFRSYDTIVIIKNLLIRDKDTLIAKKSKFINGPDTIQNFQRDIIITFRDTVLTSVDTVYSINDIVLKRIHTFSKRDNIFSKLLKNVFVFEERKPPPDTSKVIKKQTQSGQDRYSDYNGRIIGNINIRVLDVFGGNLNNPERKPSSLLEKGGNAVHKVTYRNIVRNKLLFDKGDQLSSVKVSESERLLRQTNYLYDARITVLPRENSDTVDVFILAQDVWSITPDGFYSPPTKITTASIRDANFLGLGQELYNTLRLQKSLPSGFNYTGAYTINNLYRTQSLAQLYYNYVNGEKRAGGGINREFISSAIRFAGGMNFNVLKVYTIGTDSIRRPLGFNYQDVWIGYANRPPWKIDAGTDRFVVGLRIQRTHYVERPQVRPINQFNSNYFYLMNFGYVARTFFKDNYIFRLGRTEDIPEGGLLVLTTGYQHGENTARPYFGILSTWSRYKQNVGYLYASAGIGAFRTDKEWQEGSYYTKFLYYTPLIKLGGWRLRNFISVRNGHVIKPQPGVLNDVNKENGLRALNSILLRGTDKMTINIENDFFPDFNFIGFRMGFMIFTDLAWLGNNNKLFDKDNFYQGYGIGVRIRNENLVFSMMQFVIGFYPGAERIKQNNFQYFDRTVYFYNYDDLGISRPSVVPLN